MFKTISISGIRAIICVQLWRIPVERGIAAPGPARCHYDLRMPALPRRADRLGDHLIVCGDGSLAYRITEELTSTPACGPPNSTLGSAWCSPSSTGASASTSGCCSRIARCCPAPRCRRRRSSPPRWPGQSQATCASSGTPRTWPGRATWRPATKQIATHLIQQGDLSTELPGQLPQRGDLARVRLRQRRPRPAPHDICAAAARRTRPPLTCDNAGSADGRRSAAGSSLAGSRRRSWRAAAGNRGRWPRPWPGLRRRPGGPRPAGPARSAGSCGSAHPRRSVHRDRLLTGPAFAGGRRAGVGVHLGAVRP